MPTLRSVLPPRSTGDSSGRGGGRTAQSGFPVATSFSRPMRSMEATNRAADALGDGPGSSTAVLSEYRVLPYNDPARCGQIAEERDRRSSFSSHNPTVTEHLAFVAWHSAGLQVFTTADPSRPTQVAAFVPEPLHQVATEDPALSSGLDKVVVWSYPIIQDGLIYVVDVRNGLYVLEYQGPYQEEVRSVGFLEGNSNLGEGGS